MEGRRPSSVKDCVDEKVISRAVRKGLWAILEAVPINVNVTFPNIVLIENVSVDRYEAVSEVVMVICNSIVEQDKGEDIHAVVNWDVDMRGDEMIVFVFMPSSGFVAKKDLISPNFTTNSQAKVYEDVDGDVVVLVS